MEIKLKPYNKNNPKYFKEEAKFLKKLGNYEIHHVGSTAIPGMPGKGWIDILILVPTLKQRKALGDHLAKKGYKKGKTKRRGRIFFSIDKRRIHYNLHIFLKSYRKAKEQIKFRDYLIEHPEETKKYLELKRKNLVKSKGDRVIYRKLKISYFKRFLSKNKKVNEISDFLNHF